MALTLTQTADLTKKTFVFGGLAIIVIIISFVIFNFIQSKQTIEIPIIEEKPDLKFNLLPKPILEKNVEDSAKFSYELLTTTGQLPENMPKIMKVYFISKLGTTLLAPNRAKELADSLEFSNSQEIVNPILYRFTDLNEGAITIDLDTGNFEFERKVATESGDFEEESLGDQKKLKENFKDFLSSKNLLKEQIQYGRSKITYSQGTETGSDTALISLWQDDVVETEEIRYPLVTAEFTDGLIQATITKLSSERNRYLNLQYTYWPIDYANFATYPIKTVDEAFEDLKNAKGSITLAPNSEKVNIHNVSLAYLLEKEYSKYLQPVFVFEGEGFSAIVPAIKDENFQKEE